MRRNIPAVLAKDNEILNQEEFGSEIKSSLDGELLGEAKDLAIATIRNIERRDWRALFWD